MEKEKRWDWERHELSPLCEPHKTPPVQRRASSIHGPWVAVALILSLTAASIGLHTGLPSVRDKSSEEATCPTHQIEEAFSMGALSVTVDDVWQVKLDSIPAAVRKGYDCLAVDIYITGGKREDLYLVSPSLLLPNQTRMELEDEAILSRKLKSRGVYAVNLTDCRWEDPLIGQFIFYVPTGTTGTATLELKEYIPSLWEKPTPSTIHSVCFTLPESSPKGV